MTHTLYTFTHTHIHTITEIVCQDNRVKLRRCQIEFISFSAHVDYTQNCAFIRTVSTYTHQLPSNVQLFTYFQIVRIRQLKFFLPVIILNITPPTSQLTPLNSHLSFSLNISHVLTLTDTGTAG
jgi:hypothetical protein